MWVAKFWKDLAERAIATFFEALIPLLGAGAGGIIDVGWKQALSVSAMAALVSVLKSFVASFNGDPASASLVRDASLGSGLQRYDPPS